MSFTSTNTGSNCVLFTLPVGRRGARVPAAKGRLSKSGNGTAHVKSLGQDTSAGRTTDKTSVRWQRGHGGPGGGCFLLAIGAGSGDAQSMWSTISTRSLRALRGAGATHPTRSAAAIWLYR